MPYKRLIVIFGVLLVFCGSALDAASQTRRGEKNSAELCPDEKVYTGKYRNWHYGFSIIIPAGLKGYWNSARCAPTDEGCICMTDHGRIIRLSDDAQIEAYTGYEMFEWSPVDYEKNEIADLKKRQGVEKVKVLSSQPIRLGKLKARRFALQFVAKNRSVIVERIIAVHDGVEYQLILSTSAERYTKDRRRFEEVRTSWRLTPRI